MELGLHIADFTWAGGAPALGPALARHVREAEAAGIRRISVMDHFWQIRGVGPAEHEMLEAYSALGFIAAHTEHALLHTLVTGVIYREPALLAKAVTTLNVLSGGRVGLGVGAAWNEDESRGLGFDFPPVAERFEKLEEAIRICLQMWSGSEEPFDGRHYQLGRTLNAPQSLTRPHPYLMIGGSGEKKTLRLVAQYADACNIFAGPEAARKLDVLRAHCDTVGRDYDEIEKTAIFPIDPSSTADDIAATATEMADVGFTTAYVWAHDITEPDRIIALFAAAGDKLRGQAPRLAVPSAAVRDSFLRAARDLRDEDWVPGFPVEEAAADLGGYVRGVIDEEEYWGVPSRCRRPGTPAAPSTWAPWSSATA